jgi:hypothetical protein
LFPRLSGVRLEGERGESTPADLDCGAGGIGYLQRGSPKEISYLRRVGRVDLCMADTCFGESSNKYVGEPTPKPTVVYESVKSGSLIVVFGTQAQSLGHNYGDLVVPSGSFDLFG